LVVGFQSRGRDLTKLYINDGYGNFTESSNQPFSILFDCRVKFIDIDGDNDDDLLVSSGKVFKNNNAIFTEIRSGLKGTCFSSFAFSDVDLDGDIDVFICGGGLSVLNLNDGNGNFSESDVTFFEFNTVGRPASAFGDIDGDGDDDLILSGYHRNDDRVQVKLYQNDGNGNFSEIQNTSFKGLQYGNIKLADIDQDNDLDLVLFGKYETRNDTQYKIKFYVNDGLGNFSESQNADLPIANTTTNAYGYTMLSDLDLDNDLDIIVTAFATKVFENDGLGNYLELENSPFKGYRNGFMLFEDFNSDKSRDLLLTGYNFKTDHNGTSLHFNNTTQTLKIKDSDNNVPFGFFPNPLTDNDEIFVSKSAKAVLIYDLTGRNILKFSKNKFKIDNLKEGTYIMQVLLDNNEIVTKKIIKK
jgi:hypothetical protein